MGKLGAGVLLVVLIAVLGFQSIGGGAVDVRSAINDAVESAKKSHPLTNDQEQVLRVQLAVLNFQSTNGTPPNTLAELVPAYFDSIPKNPKTQQPYEYKRDGMKWSLGKEPGAPMESDSQVASKSSGDDKSDSSAINPAIAALNIAGIKIDQARLEEEEKFVYNPSGKRDPFLPFDLAPKVNNDPSLTPLERYSLGQLRLTAVAADLTGSPTGIVEDESGKGFTVRIGTKIGDSKGEVVAIDKDILKVVETRIDFTGKETQTVVEMKLKGTVEEKKKNKKRSR